MVKETENLNDEKGKGQGKVPVARRYVTVYDSTRVILNWEMMKIADTLSQDYESMFKVLPELFCKQRLESMFNNYDRTCKGRPQAAYKILLAWMESKQGYGSVGEVCRVLKKYGYEELAESFPP